MAFKVGDRVRWSSQAGGYSKVKEGVVAQVVAPKGYPDRERFFRLYRGFGVGSYRNHESYVVLVGNKPYWPRVTHLQKG